MTSVPAFTEKVMIACQGVLNGLTSNVVTICPDIEFLITPEAKMEAISLGFMIRHDPVRQTITIKTTSPSAPKTMKASAPVVVKKVEKPDPNVPFSDYIPPKIVDDIIDLLSSPLTSNIWLFGPSQCGKSRSVHYVGYKTNRKVFQINCVGNMDTHHFFGRNTVSIDSATKQSVISFVPGTVEKAMTEGLNEKGEVVGNAGILFIDEASSMPTEIGIGLNRVLECTKNVREFSIEEDGNRLIKSHPDFRIILAGNTNGTGTNDMSSQIYTAQQCALDASLIQRMTAFFRFGYDRKAEEMIVRRSCEDDKVIEIFMEFKQGIRDALKRDNGELITPFSTKKVIDIFNMYQVFKNQFKGNPATVGKLALGKAVYYSAYELLSKEEKKKYDEIWFPLTKETLSNFSPCHDVGMETDFL